MLLQREWLKKVHLSIFAAEKKKMSKKPLKSFQSKDCKLWVIPAMLGSRVKGKPCSKKLKINTEEDLMFSCLMLLALLILGHSLISQRKPMIRCGT